MLKQVEECRHRMVMTDAECGKKKSAKNYSSFGGESNLGVNAGITCYGNPSAGVPLFSSES